MTEWKEYKLGEIAEIIPGFAFKSKDFGQIGEKVVKIKDIEPPYINLTNADCVDVSSYDISKINKYILHKGDYVVAMTGATIGKVGKLKTDNKAYLNQRVARIKAKNGICDDFVYFSIIGNDFQTFIQNNIDSNSAQENISANSIGRYPVSLPPLDTQRRIAAILSSLDDKIDLLHRENATLEQMAETLFRQWFVVEAKEEWEEGKLGNICNYVTEKIDIGNVETGDYISTENMCSNKQGVVQASSVPGNGKATKFRIDDVLLSNIRPYFKKIWLADREGGCSADVLCIRSKNELYAFFSYYTIRQDEFFDYVMLGSKGCKMPRGDKSHIMNWPITIPSKDELLKFNEIAKQGITKIRNNNKQIRTLIQMRDGLLPRLMSGEVKL
ncbi:MAG: restriction endonuclease subunit S [Salinivirgaceae bacterium]|nr:restriction endonuclease subunit S [Salinivirgaceae bacterium]